jgi:uncharacterized membrane-anchored protein YhcB (DUF1043 family)
MDNENRFALFVGLVIGMIVMGSLLRWVPENSQSKVEKLKTQCELNIPRNQKCIMQFVPGVKDEK